MYVCLTLTVFGMDGISIVTGLTDLTVSPSCVAKATQTFPGDGITVPRLTDVHVTMTLTPNTGSTHYLRIAIETTGTPADTDRHHSRLAASNW